MTLNLEEAAWLYVWLLEHKKKLPSSRQWRPAYGATSWDHLDLIRSFRNSAIFSGAEIWDAALSFVISGKWPKMKSEHKFWLRERWFLAERYCAAIIRKLNEGTTPPKTLRPNNPDEAIKFALIDHWDKHLVDIWLRENARDYIYIDNYTYDPDESQRELNQFLDKFEAGRGAP